VNTSTLTVDGDIFCDGTCTASDTIIINGSERGSIWFKDFDGAGSYITIKNEDNVSNEQVIITSSSQTAFLIEDCKYLDFRGDNDPDVYYGIKSINDGSPITSNNVRITGQSDHINISYFEIAFDGNTGAYGNGIFVQDTTEDANWTWDGIHIHHNYIHDTRYAGMYLGQNDPDGEDNPYISNVYIHDNIMEDMGAYGIGLKGIDPFSGICEVYNNTVIPSNTSNGNSTGLVFDDPTHAKYTGIGVSEFHGTGYANVYNNTVIKTVGAGIRIGYKDHNIYENIVLGCGVGDNSDYGHGILTRDGSDNVSVYDNIIIQPTRYGIYALSGAENNGTTLSRNLIGDAGIGEWDEEESGRIIESSGADANVYYADVADFGFVAWSDDGDYSNDDFTFSEDPAPNITSWENNETSNNSLAITVNVNQEVLFNVTANQTITTWTWDKDTVDQSHNYDNITLNWTTLGTKSASATATNANGSSSEIEWTVTVENAGTWSYYKDIIINHSMVYEDLVNFSVLVSITDSDLANSSQADGDDIIFKTSDGVTQLDHEQDMPFNKTTGVYLGWVRVPAVNGTVNTTIRMYYNNSEAVNSENAEGVWDSNYLIVQHLSETPDDSAGQIIDSTSNDNDGATVNMGAANQVTGQIGGCFDFDGTNETVEFTDIDGSTAMPEITVSVIVNLDTKTNYDGISDKATAPNTNPVYRMFLDESADELWRFKVWGDDAATAGNIDSDAAAANDTWVYLDGRYNGSEVCLFLDGVKQTITLAETGNLENVTNNARLGLGNTFYLDGQIDEYRVSKTGRSDGWIKTKVNNTKYPSLFLIVGTEQSVEPTYQNVSGVWHFWTYENIPELHTAINDEDVLEYNTTLDIYTFHEPFYQNVSTDTFYYNETTHLKSNNDTSPVYFRRAGTVEFNTGSIIGWNTTSNTTAPKTDTTRAYVYSDDNSTGNVKNMNISYLGYDVGIKAGFSFSECSDMTIENNTMINNYYGLYLDDDNNKNNTIHNNTITGSDESGIYLGGSSDNNTVSNNTLTSNEGNGIISMGSEDCKINNNSIHSNDGSGIYLFGSTNNELNNNSIYSNDHSGIYLLAADNNEFNNNNVSDTNGAYYDYVIVTGSDDNIFTDSIKTSNYYKFDITSSPIAIHDGVDYNITVTENTVMQDNPVVGDEDANITVVSGTIDWINVSGLSSSTSYSSYYSSNDTLVETQSSDGSGYANFTTNLNAETYYITETTEYTPPAPESLANTTGNFWVNFTWSAGSGSDTDSYNVSQNSTWVNGSVTAYNNSSVGAHGYSNIIVYAYNSTGIGTLSTTNITDNVTVPNNAITILNVSASYILNEGETLNIDANYTDPDDDTGEFADNSTDWNVDSVTGVVEWVTEDGDNGVHNYLINVTDGYGSTSTQEFTVTVNNSMYPPTVTLLSQTPAALSKNSTGTIIQVWGINHSAAGLNNTSIAYTFGMYDLVRDIYKFNIRSPDNNLAAYFAEAGENILRGINRNNTLTWETNDTITGGDVYTWNGYDYNSSQVTIEAVNSTYTNVTVTGYIRDQVFPYSAYLDSNSLRESSKTGFPIHKTSNLIVEFSDNEAFLGHNHLAFVYVDSYIGATPPIEANQIEMFYLNESFDPDGAVHPDDSPYLFYLTSMNATEWAENDYVPHVNSSYKNSIIVNSSEIEAAGINVTGKAYLYFRTNAVSVKPYYINVTDAANPTNVSFADTNVMWKLVSTPFSITQESYTPNIFTSFIHGDMQYQSKLWIQDNNSLWGNSSMETTNIDVSLFPPSTPGFDNFNVSGTPDYLMNGTYSGTICVDIGVSNDPDGGAVAHNLTLHYGNETFVAVINNTFTSEDVDVGAFVCVDFNTTPYYSELNNYTLRVVATDDENNSVTAWLPVNFTLYDSWSQNTSVLYLGVNSRWVDNSTWNHIDTPVESDTVIPATDVDFWGSY
jgi:parallel beta-helix repeat protein